MQPAAASNGIGPTGDDVAPRLIIVEDEFVVACDLCDTLESLGYAVVAVVGTGEEAVATAASVQPTAILMAIRLAGNIDSAVFLPMPGMRTRRSTSPRRMALIRSGAASPDRMVTASLGPIP